jgi:hypothetical protein
MSDKTIRAVQSQIDAMGCETFELGLFDPTAGHRSPVMLPRVWDSETLLRSIPWLRRENREGRNIFCRPKGEHNLSLVDDLSIAAVTEMKRAGFEPALVVETSPCNFQAWVNHGRPLAKALSTAVAKELAKQFGADGGAADWRHFGRLAGFTNRKEKYRDIETGLFPFVYLVEARGGVYREAARFVEGVSEQMARVAKRRERMRSAALGHVEAGPRKNIEDFRSDARYAGDGTRVDLAYAIYALSHGVESRAVEAAIESRDLSHKGTEKRQVDYVARTIRKALRAMESAVERGR